MRRSGQREGQGRSHSEVCGRRFRGGKQQTRGLALSGLVTWELLAVEHPLQRLHLEGV
jgi:hypothetical protein